MEPIRPDDDELRAGGGGAGGREAPEVPVRRRPRPESGNGRRSLAAVWLMLVLVATAAGAGWYAQTQRIEALETQLEEADYWARQSKLALARFEGELSETGENLAQRGESLEEQIADARQQLKVANSEIRKLWAVANERNKARLDQHQQRLSTLDDGLSETGKRLAEVRAGLEALRSTLTADLTALEEQSRVSLAALEEKSGQITDQLARLTQQFAEVDALVDARIRRFEQEQKLGIDGREARIAALEKEIETLAGSGQVRSLRAELAALNNTVKSIDASRAQLTSRLVRLSEEVNRLRSEVEAAR